MPLSPSTPALAALDLFCSVVELGSLSQAAEAHHIAQPSASSRIRSLEKQLNVKLLDRSPTGSRPTPEGELVAGWATAVLQSADQLNAGVEALRAQRAGRLRVSASLTIAEHLLPSWLETFLRNRTDDSVSLTVENSAAVVASLHSRQTDLGFIESPLVDDGLAHQVVAEDTLVVVVAPGHPWTRRGSVALDALVATPLVLREPGSGTRDSLDSALVELGYQPATSALELGSTSAVRAAVMSGRSPAVLSGRAVAADLAAGSLVKIDVGGLEVQRALRAVWLPDEPLPQLAEDLLGVLPGS